jgi:beta-lactamase superfamily II metal-dependent hydrolase
MIKIQMLSAGYGDTFILTIEPTDPKDEYIFLIDCGFNFDEIIRPELLKIKDAGRKVDRFIITHFDSDHIEGATAFIKENTDKQVIVKVEQIWLNTFRHLQFTKRDNAHTEEDVKKLAALKMQWSSSQKATEQEIGAKQAINLGGLLYKYGYSWNDDFSNEAVCTENFKSVTFNKSLKLRLLSPSKGKLEKLEKLFLKELKKYNINAVDDIILDDAFEIFTKWEASANSVEQEISTKSKKLDENLIEDNFPFTPDSGVANGSSIAFYLEVESIKLLFLADAHVDDIISELKLQFPTEDNYPIIFEIIKVSHHGSRKNCNEELLRIIDGPRYLFSTNGKHPKHVHPDLETIFQIIRRPLPDNLEIRELIFNYPLEHLKALDDEDLQRKYKYKITVSNEINI